MRILIYGLFILLNVSIAYGHANDSKEGVTISQQGVTHALLDENVDITLEKKKFEIRFMLRPYNEKENNVLRVAASATNEIFEKIHRGDKINDVEFFAPGTGMAADDGGYTSIFIDDKAHHYLYYSNEEDRRAKLIFRQNDLLLLEWQVSSFTMGRKESPFEKSGLQRFYLVIVNDINNNNTIDPGELNKVVITFK